MQSSNANYAIAGVVAGYARQNAEASQTVNYLWYTLT